MHLRFFVPGEAVPGGSKRAFVVGGRAVVTDDAGARNKTWRNQVATTAAAHYHGEPTREPLHVGMVFYQLRPAGHFGSGRNAGRVKPSAPLYPTVKPDVLKLARAAEDALTGVVYADDAATIDLYISKRYCDTQNPSPGLWVEIWPLRDQDEKEGVA